MKHSKFSICKRCGGRIRKHIARCKKCSEKQG
jgi:ribosomal protein L40E